MKHFIAILCLLVCMTSNSILAQTGTVPLDSIIPTRGLAIAAPSVQKIDLELRLQIASGIKRSQPTYASGCKTDCHHLPET